MSNSDFHERYEQLGIIGSAFGTVHKARDRETDEIVAMRHLQLEEDDTRDGVLAHAMRDVSLLRDLQHPNITLLLSIQTSGLGGFDLVFEYVALELHKVLRSHRQEGALMPMEQVAGYSQNLLDGVHACHVRKITHRNLKPRNILIGREGLKICDVGLAWIRSLFGINHARDAMAVWYRAPEILLGAATNRPEVDIWSSGCIVAEMATSHPTFPGDSAIDTVFRILKLLGTPTEETWRDIFVLEHWKESFPKWRPSGLAPLREMRPELGDLGIDLLKNLLAMNPQARMSSQSARGHPFMALPH
mmetsp:Transcript_30953/g.96312  ORF Transcript_30953/g.96312 Transcript_30953/m.96312 type:complete len:303 (-) Transcript_30953:459-1367(-)